jgi:NAD(P)-dependent dehydrogenase (short-subunit alcohol dehydrogenase family)
MNNTILVLGGTSGIGLDTVRYLKSKNYQVISAGRRKHAGSKNIDVTDENSVKDFFSSLSHLDGLVYSVGQTIPKKSILNFKLDEWNNLISVNLTGAILSLKYAYPFLRKSKGKVVIVNSIASRNFSAFSGFEYSSSKAALSGLVKQLSHDWLDDEIFINSVFPSATHTPMLDSVHDQNKIEDFKKSLPLKRLAETFDVARAIEFLLSPENHYMTGIGLDVNGGQYLNG